MTGVSGIYGGAGTWGDLMERDHLKDLGGRRLEDNIKTDLQKMGWGIMDWFDMDHEKASWRAL